MNATGTTFSDKYPRAFGHIFDGEEMFPSNRAYAFIRGTYDWSSASDGGLVSNAADIKKWISYLVSKYKTDSGFRKALSLDTGEYSFGFVNIGNKSNPIFWHNGALSPIGYHGDLVWQSNGDYIISLGNMLNERRPSYAREISAHILNPKEVDLSFAKPKTDGKDSTYALLAKIRIDLIFSFIMGFGSIFRRGIRRPKLEGIDFLIGLVLFNYVNFDKIENIIVIVLSSLCVIYGWKRSSQKSVDTVSSNPSLFKRGCRFLE